MLVRPTSGSINQWQFKAGTCIDNTEIVTRGLKKSTAVMPYNLWIRGKVQTLNELQNLRQG